jgi:mannose-6-phosphate isomerase
MTIPSPSHDETRPWGQFAVLADSADHKVKRLTVSPGRRLSYQTHSHRSEHWFIVKGEGIVTIDGTRTPIGPGSCVDIPVGAAHRVECTGTEALVIIEVQHGESFEEDDIVRLDDDYGRIVTVS